jgi:hypothetical protein
MNDVLRAIAVSTSAGASPVDRQGAFVVLERFKQQLSSGHQQHDAPSILSDGNSSVSISIQWLHAERVVYNTTTHTTNSNSNQEMDITVATKLLACDVVSQFLTHSYATMREEDRVPFRQAIIKACQMVVSMATNKQKQRAAEARILARTLAALVEGLVVRGENTKRDEDIVCESFIWYSHTLTLIHIYLR